MSYTFEELQSKKVAELHEIAKELEHDAVKGYTSMHRADLLAAVCKALGVEGHAHPEIVGIDKAAIKGRIRALKSERDAALEAQDHTQLRVVRRKLHRLKRKLRAATV